MNKLFCFLLAIGWLGKAFSQKQLVSNDTYKNWAKLGEYNISSDGKYISYSIQNSDGDNLVVSDIVGKWNERFRAAFTGSFLVQFTSDNKYGIFKNTGDSLVILDLRKMTKQYIANVKSFKIISNGKASLLAYSIGDDLIINIIKLTCPQRLENVQKFVFNKQGTAVLLVNDDCTRLLTLQDNKIKKIFSGKCIDASFSHDGECVVFLSKGINLIDLYLYRPGMDRAILHVWQRSKGIWPHFEIADFPPKFSPDGKHIYFKTKKISVSPRKDSALISNNVDVWHYKDVFLMSNQLTMPRGESQYTTVTSVFGNSSSFQLNDDNSEIYRSYDNNNNFVVCRSLTNLFESYYNPNQVPQYWLVSVKDGSRRKFMDRNVDNIFMGLSPGEKYAIWVNRKTNDFYSYATNSGITRNVTSNIQVPFDLSYGISNQWRWREQVESWLDSDEAFIIRDKYDVWQVSCEDSKPTINLTAGYGRANGVTFQLATQQQSEPLKDGEGLVLLGINEKFSSCFFKAFVGKSAILALGPMRECQYTESRNLRLIKAGEANTYLLVHQTAAESPNLFKTSNFKEFLRLSNFHPEKKYNWLTSELILWDIPGGTQGRGVLYKPENFDSTKQYPVIFNYYGLKSHEVHKFHDPEPDANNINIPWYVSNGYLVFVPDIVHDGSTKGKTVQVIVNTLESAAKFLSGFSWINSKKLGLQGHSFGGYETYAAITHSHLFAAANSCNAVSDAISDFGALAYSEDMNTGIYEVGLINIGTTPWDNPMTYIENTPIFYANKVTTPLLIKHGFHDGVVKFTQAIEMFVSLRRLQKPVWLLQYPGDHILDAGTDDGFDFIIRQQQFFDHYLKGKPAPLWMIEGISAKDKGIKSGLQLDSLERACIPSKVPTGSVDDGQLISKSFSGCF